MVVIRGHGRNACASCNRVHCCDCAVHTTTGSVRRTALHPKQSRRGGVRNIHHVARRDCLPAKDQRERDRRNQIAVGIHDAAAGPMPLSPIACIEKQVVAGRRATAMLPMLIEPGQRFVARENQRSKRDAETTTSHGGCRQRAGRFFVAERVPLRAGRACASTLATLSCTGSAQPDAPNADASFAAVPREMCRSFAPRPKPPAIRCSSFSKTVSERTRNAEPEQTAEHPGHANCHLRVRGRAQHHIDACRQGCPIVAARDTV